MFMGQETWYWDENTSQTNFQIQCNPHQFQLVMLILKYIWKFKRHRIGKIIFTEKKWQGNTCPSDSYFKTYYKTTVMNVLSAIKVDI